MQGNVFSFPVRILLIGLSFSILWWPLINHEYHWLELIEEELHRMSSFLSILPFHFPEIWDMTGKFDGFTIFPYHERTSIDQALIDMGHRVLTVPYFSAFGAMLETAWTRINMILILLLAASPLLITAFLWGNHKRKTKYDNFEHTHPLLFGMVIRVAGWVLLIVANLVVLPWIMPSWLVLAFIVVVAWFVYWLTANFHLF